MRRILTITSFLLVTLVASNSAFAGASDDALQQALKAVEMANEAAHRANEAAAKANAAAEQARAEIVKLKSKLEAQEEQIAEVKEVTKKKEKDKSEMPQVYGKLMLTTTYSDIDGFGDKWEIKSHASRFGIKGKKSISDDLDAIYKLEWQVDVTDEKDTKDNHIKARNQYVGLKGGWGTLIAGRHDTPLKKAQRKIDLFNDLEGDLKNMFRGEVRSDNILMYSTPKFADAISGQLMVIPGEEIGGDGGLTDSISANVQFDFNDLYVGVAYDDAVKGYDTWRIIGAYDFGRFNLGAMYSETEATSGGKSLDGYFVSGKFKFTDTFSAGLQYSDSDQIVKDQDAVSVRLDQKLSKKTGLFAYYTMFENGEAIAEDEDYLGVGIVHKF